SSDLGSAGGAAGRRRGRVVRKHDARHFPLGDDARHDRVDVAPARVVEDGLGVREARELLEVLDRREDELDLVAGRGVALGANQPQSTHSSPSTRGSWPAGAGARKKCVSNRILTSGGVIQRENLTSV